MSNNFVTFFCTTGVAGYRRDHTSSEIHFSYTVNNVTEWEQPVMCAFVFFSVLVVLYRAYILYLCRSLSI